MSPPLSVAMAVHDARPFVEEAIRSILGQSFRDFEFVIGDDGSSDGTGAVLARLAAEDARIRLVRRSRKSGLAGSANWVIGETRAPIVAIAHADDLSLPGRLERQLALFAEPEVVLVGALGEGIDEAGRRVQPTAAWRLVSPSPFAPFPHSSVMMRRAAFDAVGGYRQGAEYWEDLDLYFRLAERGRILVVAEELTRVRHTRSSARLRNDADEVYRAVDLMYRAAGHHWRGADHGPLLGARRGPGERLNPLTFVARGSIRLWSGRRPHVLRAMLRRARLRPNLVSLQALVWATWALVSPASLRWFIRRLIELRNRRARRLLAGRSVVEWRPRQSRS